MKFVFLDNKLELNKLASQEEYSQFLQSWEWGNFQESLGCKIWRVGLKEGDKILAAATFIKKPLIKHLAYFYCPRGPVGQINSHKILKTLLGYINKIAKEESAIFFRFEPLYLTQRDLFIKTFDVQPSKTIILNLDKSEEELLAQMHPKTRYNIRLSSRRGIKVKEGDKNDFDVFWQLISETSKRDKFRLHARDYYQKLFNFFTNNSTSYLDIKFLFASFKEEVLAAGIFAFFGNSAVYVHGASSNKLRNFMPTYAMQWEAIKLAKKQEKKYYDFFGIDETKWPGVTRFKKGFGGQIVQYPGTFDYVFNKVYYKIYLLARKIRRKF